MSESPKDKPEFRVGALVKLKDHAVSSVAYGEKLRDKVGIITEWSSASENTPFGNDIYPLGWGDGWVQWAGRPDQDIVYEEDLILLNE